MRDLEASLEDFFLKNLAYCAVVKHRSPSESIYSDIVDVGNKAFVIKHIESVLSKGSGERLIYLFFVDKKTKDAFGTVFKKFAFEDFSGYFAACKKRVLDDNLNYGYKLQFINFFHLIGSLRIVSNLANKREEINKVLLEIIDSPSFPFVLKYSASQIYVGDDMRNSSLHNDGILQRFYDNLKEKINDDGSFTRFVALYSMYYYAFISKERIIKHLKKRIFKNSKIDFNRLHNYLPHLHAILLRFDKSYFWNCINQDRRFEHLYETSEQEETEVRKLLDLIH